MAVWENNQHVAYNLIALFPVTKYFIVNKISDNEILILISKS